MSEVKPGYKKTELGVIPEDWEVEKLATIAEIATGNTPPTSDSGNYGEDYLFVGPGDLGKEKWIVETAKKLSQKGFEISRKFPSNSILFTCIGSTIGKSGISSTELAANQQINAVFPSKNHSVDFLFYSLNILASKIKAHACAQAVPIINKSEFGETLIPLPPTLTEQIAIATVLSDTDALIQSLDQLIAKKRNIKQGAMQGLLTGKNRLPGFGGGEKGIQVGYKQTEVGVIPEDWEVTAFRNIAISVVSGKSKASRTNGAYPVYGSTGVIGYTAKSDYSGDAVLIARVGANAGKLNLVNDEYGVTDNTIIVKVNAKQCLKYFWYQFDHKNLNEMVFGSGQPLITGTQIKDLEVCNPTLAEQTAIATVLSDMDDEIAALEQKRDKYKAIKQGLMQELLTGKIRLV